MTRLTVREVRTYLSGVLVEARNRVVAGARTTPGRLTLYLVVLIVLGAFAGVSAVAGVVQRSNAVGEVASGSGPTAVRAQQLYRSLSDADATAAAAFLAAGSEPPALRQRYLDDIAAASAALAAAGAADVEQTRVAVVAAALPVYTGLVETARTLNRLNNPLGAAYLREASALMRDQLLPAAGELYRAATDQLGRDRSAGASFPWLTLLMVLTLLVALAVTQRYLVERTNRLVNRGLGVASVAAVVLLLWVGGSWLAVVADLHRSDRTGSAQVQAIAQARVLALKARADEALTLVARGGGGSFEDDFKARMAELADPGGALDQAVAKATDPAVVSALGSARSAVNTWRAGHTEVRTADDGGDYPTAVRIAVTDPTKNSDAFAKFDSDLRQAIDVASAAFATGAGDAGSGLTFAAVAWAILSVVVVAGAVVGLQQRIAEYR